MLRKNLDRRDFLRLTAIGAAGLAISMIADPNVSIAKPISPNVSTNYAEAPSLAEKVHRGVLPSVSQRLPNIPLTLSPVDSIGKYGGFIHTFNEGDWNGSIEESQYGLSALRWLDDGMGIGPGICDTWSTNSNNTVWTLHLREGLRWSDGVATTVDDILFWWNDLTQATNASHPDAVPDFGVDANGMLAVFAKVDTYTLTITYGAPAPLTAKRLAMWVNGTIGPRWIAPKHYLSQFHPAYNADYSDYNTLVENATFRNNPACPSLDPWICEEFVPGSHLTMIRNPYYYAVDTQNNQLPYIEGWKIKITYDGYSGQIQLLQNRQVDFSLFNNFSLSDLPALYTNAVLGQYQVRLLDGGSGTGQIFYWNFDHPDVKKRAIFREPKFKQAMSLALNRGAMQNLAYFGYGFPTTGTMSPKAFEFNFNNEGKSRFATYRDAYVTFNPDQARTLLDSINVKDINGDGWRELPDGSPLYITVNAENPSSEFQTVFGIAQQNWADVGLNVQVEPVVLDWSKGKSDMHGNWEIGDGPDHLVYPSWMVPNEASRWAPLCGNLMQVEGTPAQGTQLELDPWDRTPPRWDESETQYSASVVKTIHNLYKLAIQETNELLRAQYVWQILDIHLANTFYIGTVANIPHIVLVSTNLKNVPTKAQHALGGFVNPWIVPYPAVDNPETWSFINVPQEIYLPVLIK